MPPDHPARVDDGNEERQVAGAASPAACHPLEHVIEELDDVQDVHHNAEIAG